ncbi:beta-lactamase domain-containing protein [Metarhizium acridum CQMa 102]|uniref:Beta-lactamase domain-containing protein n=1 Tax=Metarhizium acridum (strain CQMa 102) TaxID=655827 RepID=E9E3R2_METAQ|nr:beta-lactamase domain-containing protein [Metarhizium acridum CQMa 102]EFY89487.1 beta-lactamase domain-containing protein [Metarhizium acridum CQMa 102]
MSDDNRDFEFAQRGLVATFEDPLVYSEQKHEVIWDNNAYGFLQDDAPSTANKSLWRQGQLCTVTAGLYQVTMGIYQVRGADIANMTIVQIPDTNDIIIIDCLTCVETARKAFELYQRFHKDQIGQEPVIKALIYTHCHGDHFGGSQAIKDIAGDDLRIIGPDGFLEHAVSENVYAGAAMSRRSIYMYGEALDKSPTGQIGSGLGQAVPPGTSSLVAPNQTIKKDGILVPGIEGLEIYCQLTPGTEAPAEVNFYFPAYTALCMAENATHTLHNIQTLRGAPVRDARLWSRYIDQAIALFGDQASVVFASHHWPTWNENGENYVLPFLEEQRDYYAYLHNETLRQLNNGQTPVEIAEGIEMPPNLSVKTHLRGYYGSISHNVKGVYDKYMGWFDGNPSKLWPHTPADEATRYVASMGGSDQVLATAKDYIAKGDLRFAATLLNHVVFADDQNTDAKNELASVYTTLGYGCENGTWRNIYLTGASELQNGPTAAINALTPASLMALDLEELFDAVAITVNGPQAFRETGVTIEFMVEDMKATPKQPAEGAGWHVRLSNGAVTSRAVEYVPPPDPRNENATLTVWLLHKALVELVASAVAGSPKSIDSLDDVTTYGDTKAWDTITSLVTEPNLAFNIVTP